MTVIGLGGSKGCIQRFAADSVIHNVEAFARGVLRDVLFDRLLLIVDKRHAQPLDY